MVYWREKFKELEELIKTEGYDVLAPEDLIDHSRMRRFVYDTASILRLVKDVLARLRRIRPPLAVEKRLLQPKSSYKSGLASPEMAAVPTYPVADWVVF